jgi:hypothetical protein
MRADRGGVALVERARVAVVGAGATGGLDRAARITAVARDEVAIVASLAGIEDAVTAHGEGEASREQEDPEGHMAGAPGFPAAQHGVLLSCECRGRRAP